MVMDNACIVVRFHLDKLSVSMSFRFSVAYRCNLERRSTLTNAAQLTKNVSVRRFKLVKDGTGSTVTAHSQKLAVLVPHQITGEDEVSYTHSTQSTNSISGHVTPSVTMAASVWLLLIARFPSWVSQARQATWAHLLSPPAPDIGKLK